MTWTTLKTLLTNNTFEYWDILWVFALPIGYILLWVAAWVNEKRRFKKWK